MNLFWDICPFSKSFFLFVLSNKKKQLFSLFYNISKTIGGRRLSDRSKYYDISLILNFIWHIILWFWKKEPWKRTWTGLLPKARAEYFIGTFAKDAVDLLEHTPGFNVPKWGNSSFIYWTINLYLLFQFVFKFLILILGTIYFHKACEFFKINYEREMRRERERERKYLLYLK